MDSPIQAETRTALLRARYGDEAIPAVGPRDATLDATTPKISRLPPALIVILYKYP